MTDDGDGLGLGQRLGAAGVRCSTEADVRPEDRVEHQVTDRRVRPVVAAQQQDAVETSATAGGRRHPSPVRLQSG